MCSQNYCYFLIIQMTLKRFRKLKPISYFGFKKFSISNVIHFKSRKKNDIIYSSITICLDDGNIKGKMASTLVWVDDSTDIYYKITK